VRSVALALAVAVAAVGCGEARDDATARSAPTPPAAEASTSPRFAAVLARAERRFARAVARADAGRLTWDHFVELSRAFEALQLPLTGVQATGKASRARLDAAEIAQQAKQRALDVALALSEGKRPSLDRLVADLHRLQLRFELAIDRALASA
jgi:hypothetical protein